MNKLPLIEKIHLLESRLGEKWKHPLLEPFAFDSSNPVKVQEAGRKITQHLGLPPLTFIISYAKQGKNVGGHVGLDNSREVFIEIDSKFKNDYEIVLSVLAHEICHKYLHINQIQLFPEIENEMLTDAATIYTGLGKLSLNGCEKVYKDVKTIGDTTTTTTTTQKVGYMSREQFAFTYRLVCAMRRVPEKEMLHGLFSDAAQAVIQAGAQQRHFFKDAYFEGSFAEKTFSNALQNGLAESQRDIAKFDKNIRLVQERILPAAMLQSKDFHSYAKTKMEKLGELAGKTTNREAHQYVNNLLVLMELEHFKTQMGDRSQRLFSVGKDLSLFVACFENLAARQEDSLLRQFNCPSCNNKMRIGKNILARVKCPQCNYSFMVDAAPVEKASERAVQPAKSRGIWGWFLDLFR